MTNRAKPPSAGIRVETETRTATMRVEVDFEGRAKAMILADHLPIPEATP